MTQPTPPLPLGYPENDLIWCTCGEFYARASQPLCPICKDEQRRAAS